MITSERFERRLPELLEELANPQTPDYFDHLLGLTAGTRQRPAWASIRRWLPMTDIASRRMFVPRLPVRALAFTLLLIALLAAGLVAYVGSQRRVPPPFGLARNGQIVFAANGDIYTSDPVTGVSRPVVTGPEMDGNPRYSRDGTKLAFMRQVGPVGSDAFDLVVANADGSGPKVLNRTPLDTDNPYEWWPDSSSLIFTDGKFEVTRFDATGRTPPVVIAHDAYIQPGEIRPPDGRQILYEPQNTGGHALWVMDADGKNAHALVEIPPDQARDGDFGSVRWSPDGSQIAFLRAPDGDTNQIRVFVINADGTNARQLTTDRGSWVETDLVWSPDGKEITFDRWQQNEATLAWNIRPLGVVAASGGEARSIGPTPVSDGAWFDYAPDGRSLMSIPGTILAAPYPTTNVTPTLIDTATGTSRDLDWQVGSMMTWQRIAE